MTNIEDKREELRCLLRQSKDFYLQLGDELAGLHLDPGTYDCERYVQFSRALEKVRSNDLFEDYARSFENQHNVFNDTYLALHFQVPIFTGDESHVAAYMNPDAVRNTEAWQRFDCSQGEEAQKVFRGLFDEAIDAMEKKGYLQNRAPENSPLYYVEIVKTPSKGDVARVVTDIAECFGKYIALMHDQD